MRAEPLPLFHHHIAGPEDAPWVTFVPGIGNDHLFWEAQARALSDRFRVLTFDPWGHGESPPPPRPCGFDTIVAGLFTMWDYLGIERSSLVGLGFGGSVALAAGLDRPGRIDRIVACCCRPRQPDDRRAFWRDRITKAEEIGMARLGDMTVERWLAPEFRASHPAVDQTLRAMFARTTPEGYRAYVEAFIQMDFAARLPGLRVPTCLVAGEHDHGGGPVDDMAAMVGAIPGSELQVISGAGHIIVAEAPEKLISLLGEFLAR
jgi:3-oxoadipate enol-lactonase